MSDPHCCAGRTVINTVAVPASSQPKKPPLWGQWARLLPLTLHWASGKSKLPLPMGTLPWAARDGSGVCEMNQVIWHLQHSQYSIRINRLIRYKRLNNHPSWPSENFEGFGMCQLDTEELRDCHSHSDKGRKEHIVQCSQLRLCGVVATGFPLSALIWQKFQEPGLLIYFSAVGFVFFTRKQVLFRKTCVNSSIK